VENVHRTFDMVRQKLLLNRAYIAQTGKKNQLFSSHSGPPFR